MPTPPKTKVRRVKAYWMRKGEEGFLLSQVFMNRANAELVAKANNMQYEEKYKVYPVVISYQLRSKRK